MVVRDALADPRFATNPLVTDTPASGFTPVRHFVTSGGHALGTVCTG